MPQITAIVPCYNTARYLQAALESVLIQSVTDWEIIVVDDGSTDSTRQLVESLIPRFGGRLHYVYQTNRGLPAARNTAIRHAKSELIALLDADDVWLEHRLERSMAAMNAKPGIGLTHGRVARIDTEGVVVGFPAPALPIFLSGSIARNIYTRRAHLLCPTVTFRRSVAEAAGLFDERMKSTEDRDLWFRIAERCEASYIDEVIAHYRVSPNSMSRDRDRMLHWQTFFNEKHRQSPSCGTFAFREAMATAYRERGDSLFREDLPLSIRSYWQAVLYHPTSYSNLYMLFRALAEPIIARSGYRSQFPASGDAR